MMSKFIKIFKYIIFSIGIIIIIGILFSGCDIIKCYPQFDANGQYIGIKCGGKW